MQNLSIIVSVLKKFPKNLALQYVRNGGTSYVVGVSNLTPGIEQGDKCICQKASETCRRACISTLKLTTTVTITITTVVITYVST